MKRVMECLKRSLEIGNMGYENINYDTQNNIINFDLIEYPKRTRKPYRLIVEEVI